MRTELNAHSVPASEIGAAPDASNALPERKRE